MPWFQSPRTVGAASTTSATAWAVFSAVDRTALIRLVGAVLAEQHEEWIEGRRYLGLDILARSRTPLVDPVDTTEESEALTPAALTA